MSGGANGRSHCERNFALNPTTPGRPPVAAHRSSTTAPPPHPQFLSIPLTTAEFKTSRVSRMSRRPFDVSVRQPNET